MAGAGGEEDYDFAAEPETEDAVRLYTHALTFFQYYYYYYY